MSERNPLDDYAEIQGAVGNAEPGRMSARNPLDGYGLDDYEWDEGKRRENRDKHAIDFAEIRGFDWGSAVYNSSPRHGEHRWMATGYIGDRLHKVIYTERGERKRIISLRKTNPREDRAYAET